jgi:propionate catabolism operon transcriptional regulator
MSDSKPLTLKEIIFDAVLDAIDRNDGNRTRAAQDLGISRTTVFRWMREMSVPSKTLKKSD